MNIPRPPTPPIEPNPGDFQRVRRAAFVRKMRLPVAGCVALSAIAVAGFALAGPSKSTNQLSVAATPSFSETTSPEPSASFVPDPTPSATESAVKTVPPTTPTPGPSYHLNCQQKYTDDPDITGTVVDEVGNPLAGIVLSEPSCGRSVAVTDSHGQFRISCDGTSVFIGAQVFQLGGPLNPTQFGFAFLDGPRRPNDPATDYWNVATCGSTHRVVLSSAATINVTVVNPSGLPISGQQVFLGLGPDSVVGIAGSTTDADGHMTFGGLAPGRYWIASPTAGLQDFQYIDVAAGETKQMSFTTPKPPTPTPTPTPTATPTP